MQLAKVTVFRVHIPFKQIFKHASASRSYADNLIVRCEDSTGCVGWGETIAREYVTGETTEDTLQRYRAIKQNHWKRHLHDAQDVEAFLDELGFNAYNVARCGIELALLDLLSRLKKQPLYAYCAAQFTHFSQIQHMGETFRYGGAVGLASTGKTIRNALKMRLYGFRQVKMKLERQLGDDVQRLKWVRRIVGNRTDVRVDANEAWDTTYALEIAPYLQRYEVSSVEQPFPKTDRAAYSDFMESSSVPVILDESLCTLADAESFRNFAAKVIYCVKLPKVGGMFYALRIFKLADDHRIPIQLSCQVGESAILSAAGRQAAMLCPNLRYLEGSFDRYLLHDNVINGDISFRYGGKADVLNGPGLGITVNEDKIRTISTDKVNLLG